LNLTFKFGDDPRVSWPPNIEEDPILTSQNRSEFCPESGILSSTGKLFLGVEKEACDTQAAMDNPPSINKTADEADVPKTPAANMAKKVEQKEAVGTDNAEKREKAEPLQEPTKAEPSTEVVEPAKGPAKAEPVKEAKAELAKGPAKAEPVKEGKAEPAKEPAKAEPIEEGKAEPAKEPAKVQPAQEPPQEEKAKIAAKHSKKDTKQAPSSASKVKKSSTTPAKFAASEKKKKRKQSGEVTPKPSGSPKKRRLSARERVLAKPIPTILWGKFQRDHLPMKLLEDWEVESKIRALSKTMVCDGCQVTTTATHNTHTHTHIHTHHRTMRMYTR
jgi:hypothetical protein